LLSFFIFLLSFSLRRYLRIKKKCSDYIAGRQYEDDDAAITSLGGNMRMMMGSD